MTQETWDAIVIGGSAAGLSAAQALGRSLRRTLVIDSGSPRNRYADRMHNVLGNDGTPPAEFVAAGRAEAEAYGVVFRSGVVSRVGDSGDLLALEIADADAAARPLLTRSLVVATGIDDELPDVPGLPEYWGRGVLHCPYCHGWEVRDQRLAVLTTSPLGMHQVKLIRQWSDRLTAFTSGIGEIDAENVRLLESRGIELVPEAVAEVIGDGERITAVRTVDGVERPVDAIFTMPAMRPRDGFLAELELERTESPFGSFLTVDPTGKTSHPRIWAVGNVTNPAASVPIAVAAGNLAGGVVNFALIEEEFDRAASAVPSSPAEFWERRYADVDRVWSGRVNRALAELLEPLDPARSLDLGCGEGGDVLWLAERGWRASGIDLSPTAVDRARRAAEERGIERAEFFVGDLVAWAEDPEAVVGSSERYELVTASFLQSPVDFPRERVLRAAADRVAPGGSLVILAHAAPPPWARKMPGHGPDGGPGPDGAHGGHGPGMHGPGSAGFPQPDTDLAALELDPEQWEVLVAERRSREATGPDGEEAVLEDSVVVVRRRSAA